MQRYRAGVAALSLTLAVLPIAVSAAPAGLAWDSVMKMQMNADASSLQPGDFNADFAAAAAVQAPDQNSGGGIFNQMNHAMAQAKSVQQMMQTGVALRHYIAGSKERTDDLYNQTATIEDCAARTTTTLDLRKKTYRVVSWDQPSSPSSGGGGSGGSGYTDDGTRVAITVTNSALGARELSNVPTNGYRSNMVVTETKPSGESNTQNGDLIGYYSTYRPPQPSCPRARDAGTSTGGVNSPMMGGYLSVMRALASTGMSSRFSVKQSGPPLPLGKLAMYDAMSFSAQGHDISITTERGNVRSITANDAAFSIPSDFTQAQ